MKKLKSTIPSITEANQTIFYSVGVDSKRASAILDFTKFYYTDKKMASRQLCSKRPVKYIIAAKWKFLNPGRFVYGGL